MPWSKISRALRVYAVTDVKHGWITYKTSVGCLLSDLFQEPDANLHLTRVTQKQFVSAFNRLGLEVLVGTEVNFAV